MVVRFGEQDMFGQNRTIIFICYSFLSKVALPQEPCSDSSDTSSTSFSPIKHFWFSPSSFGNKFITCFSRILNLRFFFTKFYVLFFRGLQSVFFCYDEQFYPHFFLSLWKTSTNPVVMSPSRAEGFLARLVTFFTSARNRKLAENEPKVDCQLKPHIYDKLYWKYAAKS